VSCFIVDLVFVVLLLCWCQSVIHRHSLAEQILRNEYVYLDIRINVTEI